MDTNSSIIPGMATPEEQNRKTTDTNTQLGPPHEALFLVLPYLPVSELLAASQVCRSLQDAIENDVLPWLDVVVDKPLSSRLSGYSLREVVSRGNGQLRSLALVNCWKITDDDLIHIAERNPHIEKLFVPGCAGLTARGVISVAKILLRLKALKIHGIYNITIDDLQTLHSLIAQKDTGPCIDVDVCPRCSEVQMVLDCPRDTCQNKQPANCRGCHHCIRRCGECGVCIKEHDDEEVGDAACEDALCLPCWLKLPKCSFCNKPYCTRHAVDRVGLGSLPSPAFLCAACHADFAED